MATINFSKTPVDNADNYDHFLASGYLIECQSMQLNFGDILNVYYQLLSKVPCSYIHRYRYKFNLSKVLQ